METLLRLWFFLNACLWSAFVGEKKGFPKTSLNDARSPTEMAGGAATLPDFNESVSSSAVDLSYLPQLISQPAA